MKIGGYKMFLDGSPQGRTAWMRTPYLRKHRMQRKGTGGCIPRTRATKEDYCGYNTLEDSQVKENILKAELEDMQLLAHCNGDRAAEQYSGYAGDSLQGTGEREQQEAWFLQGRYPAVMTS